MKCPNCSGKLKVTNTYSGESAKTQKAKCLDCGAISTLLTIGINTHKGRVTKGEGAASLLDRLEESKDIKETVKSLWIDDGL